MKIKFLIIRLCAGIFLSLPAWLPEAKAAVPVQTSQQYNGTTKQLEQFRDDAWKRMGVPAEYQKSVGTCSVEGQQTFNTVTNRMEFCDGGKRFSLICATTLNGCIGSLGKQDYDTTLGVLRYCDGTRWIYMGSIPGVPCCPEGFVPVPKNLAAGTNKDFCVSKYHMKPVKKGTTIPHTDIMPPRDNPNLGDLGNYYPESRKEDMPWGKLTLEEAKQACNDLNKDGIPGNFHLITNAEWMTIAYNIENTPANWSGDAVGVGHLPTGHSDGNCDDSAPGCESGQNFLAASSDADPCWDTHIPSHNPNCTIKSDEDFWQKRTFILDNPSTNNVTIWDMAGNINSWVDAGADPIGIFPDPGLTAPVPIYQLNDSPAVYPGPKTVYPKISPFLFPPDPQASTNERAFLPANDYGTNYYDQMGLGMIRIENYSNAGIFRGGKFNEPRVKHGAAGIDPDSYGRHFKLGEWERRGGIYSAWIWDKNSALANVGFRCTYIPDN